MVERAKHFFIDYIAITLHASALDSSRPVRALAAARPIRAVRRCLADLIRYTRPGPRWQTEWLRTAWNWMTRSFPVRSTDEFFRLFPCPGAGGGACTLAAATQYAKGDPRNPLSLDEVIAKHRSIVAGIVDESTDDAILDFILHLETKPDFSELTRILQRFVLPG